MVLINPSLGPGVECDLHPNSCSLSLPKGGEELPRCEEPIAWRPHLQGLRPLKEQKKKKMSGWYLFLVLVRKSGRRDGERKKDERDLKISQENSLQMQSCS